MIDDSLEKLEISLDRLLAEFERLKVENASLKNKVSELEAVRLQAGLRLDELIKKFEQLGLV